MKKIIIPVLILFTFGFSCKKELIDISGYTKTDGVGNLMGAADATDWTHDPNWTEAEVAIFNTVGIANLAGTSSGSVTIFPAYPNPCSNQSHIVVQSSTKCVIRMALVDEFLNQRWTAYQLIEVGFNNIVIAPDPGKIGKGLIRLYYAFESNDQHMFYKGHGDIMFQ
ncbi:MAG TPA: hypothetical protein VF476_04355 [Chitinophagaceae bacterium]